MKRKYYRPQSYAAPWSPRFGWLAVLSLLAIIVLHRFGALATGKLPLFGLLPLIAALIALACAARGLYLLWTYGAKGGMASLRGGILALLTLAPITFAVGAWFYLPPLNQISTDLANPPAFLPGVRPADAQPVDNNWPQQTAEQLAAWPQLGGLRYDGSPDTIAKAVLRALEELDWKVVDQRGKGEETELVIETQAKTMIVGFISDIVIRLQDEGDTTYVDVRSASRYLLRDFGTNARFVRQFMSELDAQVWSTPDSDE